MHIADFSNYMVDVANEIGHAEDKEYGRLRIALTIEKYSRMGVPMYIHVFSFLCLYLIIVSCDCTLDRFRYNHGLKSFTVIVAFNVLKLIWVQSKRFLCLFDNKLPQA